MADLPFAGDHRTPANGLPDDHEVVPIDELLEWEPADDEGIETAFGRLASLLGVAAVAVAVLVLIFAAGTDIASTFRSLPGS